MVWGPNPSGVFTIKSAYQVQIQENPSHPQNKLLKEMWKLNIPPKDHPEYVQHLFAECFLARNVWGCSSTFSSLHAPNHDFIGWLSQLPCNAQYQEFDHLSKAILICWQIWEARNNLIFHGTQPHPTRCVHAAAVVGLDYWQQNHIVKPKASSPMAIKWHAPCCANKICETTINVAECLMLRDGLALALHRGWCKIIVQGDSKLIIDSVLKKVSIPWSVQQIV
ncbi:unnamed protein product [Prunus armeniaca]